jgi:serine/threonine protein kinase
MECALLYTEDEAKSNCLVPHRVITLKQAQPVDEAKRVLAVLQGRSRQPRETPISVLAMPPYVHSLDIWPTPLPEWIVVKVAISIRTAVDFLSSRGHAHCDVKPCNIFVDMVCIVFICVFSDCDVWQAGNFWLADNGGLCPIGEIMHEVTAEYMPCDLFKSSPRVDHLLLGSTLLHLVPLACCVRRVWMPPSSDAPEGSSQDTFIRTRPALAQSEPSSMRRVGGFSA